MSSTIIFFLGVSVGLLIGGLFAYWLSMAVPPETDTEADSPKVHPKHLEPSYLFYEGGYSKTNKCSHCDTIGHWITLSVTGVCPLCGGEVIRYKPAIWAEVNGVWQWVVSETVAD